MSPKQEIANWEVFLWALHQLGGASEFVDIEAVSLECFGLAPARFAWRTRPDLPDYKKCAKALQEAEARRPRMMVKTGDSFGRQLTPEGQQWVESNAPRLSDMFRSGAHVPAPGRRPTSKMLAAIERSEGFAYWVETGRLPEEKWRIADALRCSPDSSQATWRVRLDSARSVAYSADKQDVLSFLDEIEAAHPEWFGGSRE